MVIAVVGYIASKNIGPYILSLVKSYYELHLSKKEFNQFESMMINVCELGFILLTVANIAYLVWKDLESLFVIDTNLPIALIVFMVIKGTIFGIFAIQSLRFSAGFLVLIELLFTPQVRKTPQVQDDQILKYVTNMGTYITAVFICYEWANYTFLVNGNFINASLIAAAVITAIGFALKDLVTDMVASIVVIIERRFQLKDYIEIDKIVGKIIEIGIRQTTMKGLDGAVFTIPNRDLVSKLIINHSDKITDGISIKFSIWGNAKLSNRKRFERELLTFINDRCEPARDKEISNHPRVSLVVTSISDGYYVYTLEFAIRIEEPNNGNQSTGKMKYWINRERKQSMQNKVIDKIQLLAGQNQLSFCRK